MTAEPLALGLDIGGTKVVGGVVDADGTIISTIRRGTPAAGGNALRDVVVAVARDLGERFPVAAIGVGTAGLVDPARSTVLFATHLGWRNEPVRALLEAACDVPVLVENDANAAAWAEFRFGAARDATDSVIMVTVGTGVGGGFVLGGELVRGATTTAGEVGHMVAVRGGRLCGCGRNGCLDQYASGHALVRYARDGGFLDGTAVAAAARMGDPVATGAFRQVAEWLARGVADIVQLLDPQVVVIGGGLAEAGDVLMDPLLEVYRKESGDRGGWPQPQVRAAELGNLAGLVGAADLARRHRGSPR